MTWTNMLNYQICFKEDTTTGDQQRETMTMINIKHQGVNLLPGKGQVKSMQPKTQNKHTWTGFKCHLKKK